jgi:predicted PurR-regulated permease PerM
VKDYKKIICFALAVIFLFLLANSLGFVVVPFIVGLVFAYILDKPVTYLEKFKIPRVVSSLTIVLLILVILVGLVTISVPLIKNEFLKLTMSSPALISQAMHELDDIILFINKNLTHDEVQGIVKQIKSEFINVVSWVMNLVVNLLGSGAAIAYLLSSTILTPIIIFYLLKDWAKIIASIKNLIPSKYIGLVTKYCHNIDQNLSEYAKGQSLACLVLTFIYSISLWSVGLNYGIMVGIITGIVSFVPYAGAIVGFIISSIIALQQFANFQSIIKIGVIFLLIQFLEGYFIVPRLVGNKIGLHPVWMIFALLAGISWFGILGLVLAIPVATIIRVLITSIKENYRYSC